MRKRTSKIWSISKDEMINIVKNSSSINSILNHFGLRNIGGNYLTLRKRLIEDDINFSHIKRGTGSNKGRKFPLRELTKDECLGKYFILNDNVLHPKKGHLNFYIKKFKLLEYKCKCDNEGIWKGEQLNLQLHHIDGNNLNNQISNLKWLCPNCHSQTPNFSGRKRKIEKNRNWRMESKENLRKVIRPSKEELTELIKKQSILSLSREFKVSDVAVRKWCKSYDLNIKELSPFSHKNVIAV